MMTLNPFTIKRKAGPFMAPLAHSAMALVLLNGFPSRVLAQDSHSHAPQQEHEATKEAQSKAGALLENCARINGTIQGRSGGRKRKAMPFNSAA